MSHAWLVCPTHALSLDCMLALPTRDELPADDDTVCERKLALRLNGSLIVLVPPVFSSEMPGNKHVFYHAPVYSNMSDGVNVD